MLPVMLISLQTAAASALGFHHSAVSVSPPQNELAVGQTDAVKVKEKRIFGPSQSDILRRSHIKRPHEAAGAGF